MKGKGAKAKPKMEARERLLEAPQPETQPALQPEDELAREHQAMQQVPRKHREDFQCTRCILRHCVTGGSQQLPTFPQEDICVHQMRRHPSPTQCVPLISFQSAGRS